MIESQGQGMRVITLGTAGGPRWWDGPRRGERAGISTAVEVDGAVYLVDCGLRATDQLHAAGLGVDRLRAVLITHLHSDHVIDFPALVLFGSIVLTGENQRRIPVIGPGDRGAPFRRPDGQPGANVAGAESDAPGVDGLLSGIVRAFAADVNNRAGNTLRPSPSEIFTPEAISIPSEIDYHPDSNPDPDMDPIVVYTDELVQISAILVHHPPMSPAFAFRIDSRYGSVVISGDTAPCDNLVKLATDCDVLLHEALDFDLIGAQYGDVEAALKDASLAHHRRSHTSVSGALDVAKRAGASALALHHLVPGAASDKSWTLTETDYEGRFLVPEDLDVIEVGALQ